jgi:16S rRNA (guanine527-N7)-methyltransferase
MLNAILSYFPSLTPLQIKRFEYLSVLYPEWNAKINVISRKDIGQLYLHHVLHSLAIARVIRFANGTTVLDAGTGGGFPGIPLAILFPETRFTLVDSIGKKIKVVEGVSNELELTNVVSLNARFESVNRTFDFVTGRAVSNVPLFFSMVRHRIRKSGVNDLPNGILYLTGGDVAEETASLPAIVKAYPIADFFSEPYFDTKKVVHISNFSV